MQSLGNKTSSSNHPVFQRFSRQQLITRRRHIGFQTLICASTATKTTRCRYCGRRFDCNWETYLCHVCGHWVCLPCSTVLERERELHRIQFMRSCYACLPMLHRWSDSDLLTELAASPWVVACSKSQISLNLSDALRTQKKARRGVLLLLKYLGMNVDPSAAIIDTITESEWVAATTQGMSHRMSQSGVPIQANGATLTQPTSSTSASAELAQHLVQLCFDLTIPSVPLSDCKFAESDGFRSYAMFFPSQLKEELPEAPIPVNEPVMQAAITRYGLMHRSLATEEVKLICRIAAKELDAALGIITVVAPNTHLIVGACQLDLAGSTMPRSQAFCSYQRMYRGPFFIRNAALDIRFRNMEGVRGGPKHRFYLGFPIMDDHGSVIASLCVVDPRPRKHLTTMQYSIMKALTEALGRMWYDMLVMESS